MEMEAICEEAGDGLRRSASIAGLGWGVVGWWVVGGGGWWVVGVWVGGLGGCGGSTAFGASCDGVQKPVVALVLLVLLPSLRLAAAVVVVTAVVGAGCCCSCRCCFNCCGLLLLLLMLMVLLLSLRLGLASATMEFCRGYPNLSSCICAFQCAPTCAGSRRPRSVE